MPSLKLTPNPIAPGGNLRIEGSGFNPKRKVQVALDGSGWTTNYFRPVPTGSFVVGCNVSNTPQTQTVSVRDANTRVVLATAQVVVENTLPPSAEPDFLDRTSSPAIVRNGGVVLIEDVAIDGGTLSSVAGIGITVTNATSVTIRNVDLADLVGGIYLYNCTGTVLIENVRSRNIGDGTIGSGHSNHIQIAESSLSGSVRNNRFLGGRTEDMVSIWHSGGRGVGLELVIEDNKQQGLVADTATARAWNSGSGTGIIVGDGSGSPKNGHTIIRRNTLLTPGQVGIQLIDGPSLQVYENIVYGEQRAQNNNPITSWEGNPRGVIRDNRWYWTNADGSHPSPWFHMSPSGMTGNVGTADPSLNPATLAVSL